VLVVERNGIESEAVHGHDADKPFFGVTAAVYEAKCSF
jgi:hypothetical protein